LDAKHALKKAEGIKRSIRAGSFFKHYQLYLLLLPALLYIIIFKYIPMYGIQIAFREYNAAMGITGSPWVGLQHFETFIKSYQFKRLMKNTLGIGVYQIVAGFPFPIVLALSLNECRKIFVKKTVQTVTYAPYFISVVVMVAIINQVLSVNGFLNNILDLLGLERVNLFLYPGLFKSIYVWSGIWQTCGYGAVIYLAALASINPELYESSRIDGATTLQKIRYIDIPGIMPTAIILLILNSSQILNVGFEKVYLMQTPLNRETSDVIRTYVYRLGLLSAQYSYSAAIELFNSIITFIVMFTVNSLARRYSETSLW